MKHIPPEYFDRFYGVLVGSQPNIDATEQFLAEHITPPTGSDKDVDPYAQLQTGFIQATRQSIKNCISADPDPLERRRWGSIYANGQTGAQLTIAGLRAVGKLYEKHATVPQDKANVARNVTRVLGHVFGTAHAGKFVASVNLEANRWGLNPRNPLVWPYLYASFVTNIPIRRSFHRAFRAVEDETGQLDFQLRHKRMGKVLDRQCPATVTKVDTIDGRKSGLWALMQTAGRVAVSEIYPRQFDITPSQ